MAWPTEAPREVLRAAVSSVFRKLKGLKSKVIHCLCSPRRGLNLSQSEIVGSRLSKSGSAPGLVEARGLTTGEKGVVRLPR